MINVKPKLWPPLWCVNFLDSGRVCGARVPITGWPGAIFGTPTCPECGQRIRVLQ